MNVKRPGVARLALVLLVCALAVCTGCTTAALAQDSDALRALRGVPTEPGKAPGSPAKIDVSGEWSGRYSCGQGITGVRVVLSPDGSRGLFHFYAVPENPRVPEGCYRVSASFQPGNRILTITAGSWIVRPRHYASANVTGFVDPDGQGFIGRIVDLAGCTVIVMKHEPSSRSLPNACARGLP